MPRLLLTSFDLSSEDVSFRRACLEESQPLKRFADYSLESSLIDVCTHFKRLGAVPSFPFSVVTRMVKKFEGAHWKHLLKNSLHLLRQTFTVEASRALGVLPEQIRDVELRLGSLHVTFHVTHDDDVSQEEMRQRIEDYPFNEVWRLYSQFDGATLDWNALGSVIKGFEEQLAQKDMELNSARKANEENTCELIKEFTKLKNSLEEVENRERNLAMELEKEKEYHKTTKAQLTASNEENQRLSDDLKCTRNHFVEFEQRYEELIVAIAQENKRERDARERELNEQITAKTYIIQDLEAKLRKSQGVEADQLSSLNRSNGGASNRLAFRIEELSLQLRLIERSEIETYRELGRISESLKIAEKA